MTTYLTAQQAQRIRADMKTIIASSSESATRTRQTIAPVGFGGQALGETVDQVSFPMLRKQLPESDLTLQGNVLVISVLPDVDIREVDIVTIGDMHYGVTDVLEQNLFGVVTHLDVKLELMRSGSE